MLINDKSQLKRNAEQIGFQLALKTSKSSGPGIQISRVLTSLVKTKC